MGINKDCFAYSEKRNDCTALTELFCKKENCSFYMTKEQYLEKMLKNSMPRND